MTGVSGGTEADLSCGRSDPGCGAMTGQLRNCPLVSGVFCCPWLLCLRSV